MKLSLDFVTIYPFYHIIECNRHKKWKVFLSKKMFNVEMPLRRRHGWEHVSLKRSGVVIPVSPEPFPSVPSQSTNMMIAVTALEGVMIHAHQNSSTYDHRVWRTGLPVRSAVLKPHAGQLVVWWVTTCES